MNLQKNKGFLLLKGGKVYDPFIKLNGKKDILIKDDSIVAVDKNIPKKTNYKVIDCSNTIITNGFLDLHVHFREPGFEYKETLKTGAESAFSGGFTRVCVMPNTKPVLDSPELIKYVIDKSESLPVFIYPIGAITKQQKGKELAEIGSMVSKGAVAISDDGIPVTNSQILRMALEYSKKFGIPVINHAEDINLVNDGLVHEGFFSLKLGLPSNPDISESTMVFRDLSIADYIMGKIHVPHVSSYKSVEVIKQFKNKGLNVSSEVTPHHLYLTDEALHNYNTNAKVAPPIRSEKDRKFLVKAIKNGIIDCIASDHAPHSIEDKEKDFKHAPCGMIGLESSFGIVNKVLRNEKMSIESIINLFTINPSQIINIKPNAIQKGEMAELNVINPKLKWNFNEENIKSKSKNSPILGHELIGKILITINKGFVSSFTTSQ